MNSLEDQDEYYTNLNRSLVFSIYTTQYTGDTSVCRTHYQEHSENYWFLSDVHAHCIVNSCQSFLIKDCYISIIVHVFCLCTQTIYRYTCTYRTCLSCYHTMYMIWCTCTYQYSNTFLLDYMYVHVLLSWLPRRSVILFGYLCVREK